MARADLLVRLVRYASRGNRDEFRRVAETLIAEERENQHHILADRLEESLRVNGNGVRPVAPISGVGEPVMSISPDRRLDSLILPDNVRDSVAQLVNEQHRAEILRSHNLEPRHRVLLAGPPGNGKTSLAEALATELMVPFFVVRYESVVASYLGETSSRLSRLFDFVKTRHCVLFFDEFDTLGKERGDEHETGEIKRVVSTLLLQIDQLPSHVVVVTATNHPELLDRAVWRRFQLRLGLPLPDGHALAALIERIFRSASVSVDESMSAQLSAGLEGLSFGEAEEFALDVLRRYVLADETRNIDGIVRQQLDSLSHRFAPPGGTA